MKTITLEEFAELAKKDEALKEKIMKIATSKGENQIDEMNALAAEQGYKLTLEEKMDGLEEVSDDALDQVAGGIKFFGDAFCVFMMDLFGFDGKDYCD